MRSHRGCSHADLGDLRPCANCKAAEEKRKKGEVLATWATDQGNTYGSLKMVLRGDGYHLTMEDCFAVDFTGPLTVEQVQAFFILFDECDPDQGELK